MQMPNIAKTSGATINGGPRHKTVFLLQMFCSFTIRLGMNKALKPLSIVSSIYGLLREAHSLDKVTPEGMGKSK